MHCASHGQSVQWPEVDFLVRLLRYRMAGITESAMVAYTHKYAVV